MTQTNRAHLAERLRTHVEFLAAAPRNGRTSPHHLAACIDYCATTLAASGWAVERHQVSHRNVLGIGDDANPLWPFHWYRTLTGTNLVAAWGSEGPALVIVAHIDTVGVSPGADDNASGVASALEVARLIAEAGSSRRVLIALVDLEETGHQGSKHLARTLVAEGAEVCAVICLESIGYYNDASGSQRMPRILRRIHEGSEELAERMPADFITVIHRASSTSIARDWARAAEDAGLRSLRFLDRRPDGWRAHLHNLFNPSLTDLDRSDHQSFQDLGFPALCISDTPLLRGSHYHQASDRAGTLDYTRMAATTLATFEVARDFTPRFVPQGRA